MNVPVLETERLHLRGWREDDLAAYSAFWADAATADPLGGICTRDEAWRRMAARIGHWVLRGYGQWVVEEKASGRFAGYCGPWYPESWPEQEIGWGVLKAFQGRGYATEAARRARVFAYRELGWPTAVSYIAADNGPSQRVAARLGASLEGTAVLRGQYPVGVYRHPGPDQQANSTN